MIDISPVFFPDQCDYVLVGVLFSYFWFIQSSGSKVLIYEFVFVGILDKVPKMAHLNFHVTLMSLTM